MVQQVSQGVGQLNEAAAAREEAMRQEYVKLQRAANDAMCEEKERHKHTAEARAASAQAARAESVERRRATLHSSRKFAAEHTGHIGSQCD